MQLGLTLHKDFALQKIVAHFARNFANESDEVTGQVKKQLPCSVKKIERIRNSKKNASLKDRDNNNN